MSLIALSLNVILIGLLVCALFYGIRLERKLKAIRDGQVAFGRAVADLDSATERARSGLAELRQTTDESTDLLGGRIARAREAADRLERLLGRAEAMPAPREGPEGGLSALLAELKAAEIAPQPMPAPMYAAGPAAARRPDRPSAAVRPMVDEDLFDDAGGRA